ncbi:fasciclin domain-containing protein [Microbacterium sp. CFBP9034]|uniref:fasciclin domain-containing protein n=1 Tax=Microbacterium sp. CFBP9034 TaxID=3096540 RepID=UPI002A6B6D27|nr:fasciclin domain-containing protein [Microbacterium sp. CFBP9034]MDY0910970.1 fasciclin domain-containing protein [Microbacterium sp. CFBP9034]
MKKIIATAAAAALLVIGAATPAQAADPRPAHGSAPTMNIVQTAVAASGGGTPDANPNDYDILVQAVLATELAEPLSGGTWTVFAPTDRAFLRLVRDLTGVAPASEAEALTTITTAFTIDQIREIVLYHAVEGRTISPLRLILTRSLTMADGGVVRPIGIVLRDESPTLRNPKLVLSGVNIKATNGVIHTIDRVLVPSL